MTHFPILLRNLQPKKVHGKPGQAVALLTATKKTHVRASASNTTFRLNCYVGFAGAGLARQGIYRNEQPSAVLVIRARNGRCLKLAVSQTGGGANLDLKV